MTYVYLLRSLKYPEKSYVGKSSQFDVRIAQHNAKVSPYTAKFAPWKATIVIGFENDAKADAFERYLKSGSGHTFAKRHFW